MKTAMQELIDWIDSWKGSFLDQTEIKEAAIELLEKEKQQIQDAVNFCYKIDEEHGYIPYGIDYYNQKYNHE